MGDMVKEALSRAKDNARMIKRLKIEQESKHDLEKKDLDASSKSGEFLDQIAQLVKEKEAQCKNGFEKLSRFRLPPKELVMLDVKGAEYRRPGLYVTPTNSVDDVKDVTITNVTASKDATFEFTAPTDAIFAFSLIIDGAQYSLKGSLQKIAEALTANPKLSALKLSAKLSDDSNGFKSELQIASPKDMEVSCVRVFEGTAAEKKKFKDSEDLRNFGQELSKLMDGDECTIANSKELYNFLADPSEDKMLRASKTIDTVLFIYFKCNQELNIDFDGTQEGLKVAAQRQCQKTCTGILRGMPEKIVNVWEKNKRIGDIAQFLQDQLPAAMRPSKEILDEWSVAFAEGLFPDLAPVKAFFDAIIDKFPEFTSAHRLEAIAQINAAETESHNFDEFISKLLEINYTAPSSSPTILAFAVRALFTKMQAFIEDATREFFIPDSSPDTSFTKCTAQPGQVRVLIGDEEKSFVLKDSTVQIPECGVKIEVKKGVNINETIQVLTRSATEELDSVLNDFCTATNDLRNTFNDALRTIDQQIAKFQEDDKRRADAKENKVHTQGISFLRKARSQISTQLTEIEKQTKALSLRNYSPLISENGLLRARRGNDISDVSYFIQSLTKHQFVSKTQTPLRARVQVIVGDDINKYLPHNSGEVLMRKAKDNFELYLGKPGQKEVVLGTIDNGGKFSASNVSVFDISGTFSIDELRKMLDKNKTTKVFQIQINRSEIVRNSGKSRSILFDSKGIYAASTELNKKLDERRASVIKKHQREAEELKKRGMKLERQSQEMIQLMTSVENMMDSDK